MRAITQERLEAICEEICDTLCRWPLEVENQGELDDKCAGCQTLIDLANLVEGLEKLSAGKETAG